jgi:uncharacterized protein (DUF427 family)
MRARPLPVRPEEGQESVWDYPRPPRLERVRKRLRVTYGGLVIADTTGGFRVLETSHPPVYFFPAHDVRADCLVPCDVTTNCEWKGRAVYFDVMVGKLQAESAAWSYPNPTEAFRELAGAVAFYAGRLGPCTVDGEVVEPQPGDFYGGWITKDIVGPFKGEPGTWGW